MAAFEDGVSLTFVVEVMTGLGRPVEAHVPERSRGSV
jgi:hypothetical protein